MISVSLSPPKLVMNSTVPVAPADDVIAGDFDLERDDDNLTRDIKTPTSNNFSSF